MFDTKPTQIPATVRDADGMAVLGRTLHALRGIRFGAGEGGDGGTGGDAGGTGGDGGDGSSNDGDKGGSNDAGGSSDDKGGAGDKGAESKQGPVGGVAFADLPKETQDEVRRLRKSDQTLRADLKNGMTEERRQELGRQLGFLEDDKAPSAEELAGALTDKTTRLTETEAENMSLKRENMVLQTAPDAGANAAQLLDSKGFAEVIKGLEPNDKPALTTAIKDWVEKHPTFAANTRGALPARSGDRQQGAGKGQSKPGLEGAIAAQMNS